MRWRLMALLIGFGALISVLSLFGINQKIYGMLWLVLYIGGAILLGRQADSNLFWQGALVGLCVMLLKALLQYGFFDTYAAHQTLDAVSEAQVRAWNASAWSWRQRILAAAPLSSVLSSLLMGLLTLTASKVFHGHSRPLTGA
jgi:hypothetical protein